MCRERGKEGRGKSGGEARESFKTKARDVSRSRSRVKGEGVSEWSVDWRGKRATDESSREGFTGPVDGTRDKSEQEHDKRVLPRIFLLLTIGRRTSAPACLCVRVTI